MGTVRVHDHHDLRLVITITFNGDKKDTAEGQTVAAFVDSLGLEAVRVAVEKNTRVIRRKNWSLERIEAGDSIEVVTFVGGGCASQDAQSPELDRGAVSCSTLRQAQGLELSRGGVYDSPDLLLTSSQTQDVASL